MKNNQSGSNIAIVNATCTYDSINNNVWIFHRYLVDVYPVYEFQNQSTGACITTRNAATSNNAPLITFTCNGGHNSLWIWN